MGFISRDTYDEMANSLITQNYYAYANSNPSMLVDPSGHMGMMSATFFIMGIFKLSSI